MTAKRSKSQILLDLIEGEGLEQAGYVHRDDQGIWMYRGGGALRTLGNTYQSALAEAARLGKERRG